MTEYYTTQSFATAAAAIERGLEGYDVIPVTDCSCVESYSCNGSLTAISSLKYVIYRFPKTPHNGAWWEQMQSYTPVWDKEGV